MKQMKQMSQTGPHMPRCVIGPFPCSKCKWLSEFQEQAIMDNEAIIKHLMKEAPGAAEAARRVYGNVLPAETETSLPPVLPRASSVMAVDTPNSPIPTDVGKR